MIKSYGELRRLGTFDERFEYLRFRGSVGEDTFGFNRILNQKFYTSRRWREIRNAVIVRDGGCDLGVDGYDIFDKIIVHHINPITKEDVINDSEKLYDLNNLVCTSNRTHNAIHYSSEEHLSQRFEERTKDDTSPWRV